MNILKLRENIVKELELLPKTNLNHEDRKAGRVYFEAYKEGGKKVRKGITRDIEKVKQLARKGYLLRMLKAIDEKIISIKEQEISSEEILKLMPEAYRQLPPEYMLNPYYEVDKVKLDREKEARKKKYKAWREAKYSQSKHRPEGKTNITSRGLKVRSRAEALVIERLYEYEVPFRYEQLLILDDGEIIAPDMTIPESGGGQIYIEYAGMMDDPKYVKDYMKRRNLYEKNGLYEWDKVIYIYGTDKGIDVEWIDEIIKHRILPRL